jgi:hypothetical protein
MKMRWAGHVARMREKRNAYRVLAAKPEGEATRKTVINQRIILKYILEN